MQVQPLFLMPAIQISNVHKHLECLKNIKNDGLRFLKVLNKLYSNIKEVDEFLQPHLAHINAKEATDDYTAEERQIIKLAKNILQVSADFNALVSSDLLIETIQSTLRTWKKHISCLTARRPAAEDPPIKKARLIDSLTLSSFNNLPNDLVNIICSYASWMAPLNLLCTNRRLHAIYKHDPSSFMEGLRLVNQTMTKVKTFLGDIDFRTLLHAQDTNVHTFVCGQSTKIFTTPTGFHVPVNFVLECIKKGLYKAIEEENLDPQDFVRYLNLLIRSQIGENQDYYIKDLFHYMFPEACLKLDTPQTFALTFEGFVSKLKQESLPAEVDFKTGLLIEFITNLPIPIDMLVLAWQVLGERTDLATAPHKLALLASLWQIGAHEKYFPQLPSLQAEIIAGKTFRGRSCAHIIDLLDLNQALIGAYFSSPEKKVDAFAAIFQQHLQGVWTLDLYQIEQILASWSNTDVTEANYPAYIGSWDLVDSYVVAYCKMAEPLLQILVDRLKVSNPEKIKQLTHTVCKHIEDLTNIDIDIYEDPESHSGHGSYQLPVNFGAVLQLVDKLDATQSTALFAKFAQLLPYIIEDNLGKEEIKDFTFSVLAWDKHLIYTFLNDFFKDNEEMQVLVIEQYLKYNPLTALQLAYTYCSTDQICLNLIAKILYKLDYSIADDAAAIIQASEFVKQALKKNESLNANEFITSLAALNAEMAMEIALQLKNIDNRSSCALKIIQKNLSTYNSPNFYQNPEIIEKLTKATTPKQTVINRQVFNFLFNLSDVVKDFRQLIFDLARKIEPTNLQQVWHWSSTLKSLYSALVEVGMPPQKLIQVIQDIADSLPSTDIRKGKLWHWLLKEGSKLMGKIIYFTDNHLDT